MFNTLATLFTAALVLNPVLARVYITSPVGTTVGTGGQVLNVSWGEFFSRLITINTMS